MGDSLNDLSGHYSRSFTSGVGNDVAINMEENDIIFGEGVAVALRSLSSESKLSMTYKTWEDFVDLWKCRGVGNFRVVNESDSLLFKVTENRRYSSPTVITVQNPQEEVVFQLEKKIKLFTEHMKICGPSGQVKFVMSRCALSDVWRVTNTQKEKMYKIVPLPRHCCDGEQKLSIQRKGIERNADSRNVKSIACLSFTNPLTKDYKLALETEVSDEEKIVALGCFIALNTLMMVERRYLLAGEIFAAVAFVLLIIVKFTY